MAVRKKRREEIRELNERLREEGFAYVVDVSESTDRNGHIRTEHVWKYVGNDLNQARNFAFLVMLHKEAFFCHESQSIVRARLVKPTNDMVDLLVAMVESGRGSFEYPNDFPKSSPTQARGFTTNYSDLAPLGLLRKEMGGIKPIYVVTEEGRRFVQDREPTYSWVLVKGRKILKRGPKNFLSKKVTAVLSE